MLRSDVGMPVVCDTAITFLLIWLLEQLPAPPSYQSRLAVLASAIFFVLLYHRKTRSSQSLGPKIQKLK